MVPQGVIPNLFKLAPAAGISWFTFEVRPDTNCYSGCL